MLNWIWAAFFLIAFAVAIWQAVVGGKPDAMGAVVASLFDSSKTAFEIAIGLTGVMSLWLGLMKIAERGSVTEIIAKAVGPLFRRLFPGIPDGHPASGAIVMNRSANMLGLDNAATPLGLKAMKELQSLNPEPDRATNEMILFMVMNASSVTLVPISIMTFRAQLGAKNPADVFVPILIATFISDLSGLLLVAAIQKLNLFNRVVLAWLGSLTLAVAGLVWYFARLAPADVAIQSGLLADSVLIGIVASFLVVGAWRRLPMYETFVEGALRASGALDAFLGAIKTGVAHLNLDTRWVDAMPVALIKPLSGGGARGMMVDTMKAMGADSFAGRLACVIQGSTETTFYVLAVYFGSVGVRRTRYALGCALFAEAVGVIAAIGVTYLFFG
jgi:spore maturation protein SpmA/spore maturation protein SpmB